MVRPIYSTGELLNTPLVTERIVVVEKTVKNRREVTLGLSPANLGVTDIRLLQIQTILIITTQ